MDPSFHYRYRLKAVLPDGRIVLASQEAEGVDAPRELTIPGAEFLVHVDDRGRVSMVTRVTYPD